MSEDKMGIVRRAVEAASGKKAGSVQEVDALDPSTLNVFLAFLHPEVEVHEDRSFPEAGVYRGREAVRDYFRGFTAEFDEFRFEIEDVIDAGNDDVLVLMHLRGRGKGSGAPFDARPGWLYKVRDGEVRQIRAYLDRTEALKVAGLAPP